MKQTKMTIIVLIGLIFSLISCEGPEEESKKNKKKPNIDSYKHIGSIERMDASINQLIPEDAKIEVLAEGFDWTEGPLWVEEGQYVLFSDIPPNSIYKWAEGEGKSLYLTPSGYTGEEERGGEVGSNGLLLSPE
ncbi:MAG: hypothetical protein AAF696_35215 [Bacteroidota bacterium]